MYLHFHAIILEVASEKFLVYFCDFSMFIECLYIIWPAVLQRRLFSDAEGVAVVTKVFRNSSTTHHIETSNADTR